MLHHLFADDLTPCEWNVTLDVHYGERPIGPWRYEDAQLAMDDFEVNVAFGATRCTARFRVHAAAVEEATSAAVARWHQARVAAELPVWRITRLVVDLVAEPIDDRHDIGAQLPHPHLVLVRDMPDTPADSDRPKVSRFAGCR